MAINVKIPITKSDKIASYRKKNRAVRHEYYTLSSRHSDMDCYMYTFTSSIKGTYQKLRLINEIKTYITYLIANSCAEIYFFSNIELGHSFTNPHIHTQIWADDLEAVRVIYDKVIAKFSLNKKRCKLSEPQQQSISYSYVLKDYAESLDDDRLWAIEMAKKRMRKQLALKLRFYSRSKSKYTQKAYRYFYRAFGVLRGVADEFIDWFLEIFFNKEVAPNTPQRGVSWSIFLVLFIYRTRGLMSPTLMSETYLKCKIIGVLFYSPAHSPPLLDVGQGVLFLDVLLF